MTMKKEEKSSIASGFKELKTAQELVAYLDNPSRLDNSPFLYQYTRISNLIHMFRERKWHLCNAKGMNDVLEYKSGDANHWKDLFFTCFMGEDSESIGMWSMYAQPWEKGVKIGIPKTALRRWAKEIDMLYEIDPISYQLTGRKLNVKEEGVNVKISAVSYSNIQSRVSSEEQKTVSWSNKRNTLLSDAIHDPILTGYIKDMAWSYEKEVRLKATFENSIGFQRTAVEIPDYVIDNMTITTSPLFEGSLEAQLEKEITHQFIVQRSLFTGKLNIKDPCKSCEYKQSVK